MAKKKGRKRGPKGSLCKYGRAKGGPLYFSKRYGKKINYCKKKDGKISKRKRTSSSKKKRSDTKCRKAGKVWIKRLVDAEGKVIRKGYCRSKPGKGRKSGKKSVKYVSKGKKGKKSSSKGISKGMVMTKKEKDEMNAMTRLSIKGGLQTKGIVGAISDTINKVLPDIPGRKEAALSRPHKELPRHYTSQQGMLEDLLMGPLPSSSTNHFEKTKHLRPQHETDYYLGKISAQERDNIARGKGPSEVVLEQRGGKPFSQVQQEQHEMIEKYNQIKKEGLAYSGLSFGSVPSSPFSKKSSYSTF